MSYDIKEGCHGPQGEHSMAAFSCQCPVPAQAQPIDLFILTGSRNRSYRHGPPTQRGLNVKALFRPVTNLWHDRHQRHPTDLIDYNGVYWVSVKVSIILPEKSNTVCWTILSGIFFMEPATEPPPHIRTSYIRHLCFLRKRKQDQDSWEKSYKSKWIQNKKSVRW